MLGAVGFEFGLVVKPPVRVVAGMLPVQCEQDARVIVAQIDAPVDDPGARAAEIGAVVVIVVCDDREAHIPVQGVFGEAAAALDVAGMPFDGGLGDVCH